MTSRQAQLQEDTYFRVMRILQENPDLTQRELAEKLGVSVGGLNYCLNALMDRGWVKMQNFQNSKNKFKYGTCHAANQNGKTITPWPLFINFWVPTLSLRTTRIGRGWALLLLQTAG